MFDFIILGQGLAGSAIAYQLIKRNYRILIIDDAGANNSSRIAAGLFNPITGKRLLKTWMADTLFPYLHHYYKEIETLTGSQFYHPMPVYRPFLSVEEQNEWMGRSADPTYQQYINQIFTEHTIRNIKDPFGGVLLKQSGYVNTTQYIDALRILFRERATLSNEAFQPHLLKFENDIVKYGNHKADKLIVCSGTHAFSWFDWIPVIPLKGETITIDTNYVEETIINRGIYMIPSNKTGNWRVGATYNFNDKVEGVTSGGRTELENKVGELVDFDFEIQTHEWGMRPTTPDRRPILGCHPEKKSLFVFNGLGTKGISLAPYFSQVLIHWIEKKQTLNKEVDIQRFKSLYSGSSN